MKSKKILMTAALSALLVSAVQAQEETRGPLKSYSYVEAQGGMQLTSTDAKMTKLMLPTAAISFGHYFTPVVGARIHVNGWQAKSGYDDVDKYYKWKYIIPDLDVMFNLTNLFSSNKSAAHPLNVILLGGVGLQYVWDNDELKNLNLHASKTAMAWDKNRLGHNLRAGLRLETDVTKPIGLSLEVNANSQSDRINSKLNSSDDWQFTAMLGLSVRFGRAYEKPAPKPAPVVEEVVEPEPVVVPPVVVKKVKKEITKEEPIKLHKEVFYAIRVSQNETPSAIMEQIANFVKENKNVKVSVVGYADKGTGNAKVNKRYAEKRAEQFKDDLVKRHGIDESIITIDSKGDTVQPFAENDKNRCVIVDAEGIRVYKEIIEVEEKQ